LQALFLFCSHNIKDNTFTLIWSPDLINNNPLIFALESLAFLKKSILKVRKVSKENAKDQDIFHLSK